MKKWLSYRDRDVLGCHLQLAEVQHFSDAARRVSAILFAAKTGPRRSC